MFACIRRRQIIAANEKFSFQPLLERVMHLNTLLILFVFDMNSPSSLFSFVIILSALSNWTILNIFAYTCCSVIESSIKCGVFDNGRFNTSATNWNTSDWHWVWPKIAVWWSWTCKKSESIHIFLLTCICRFLTVKVLPIEAYRWQWYLIVINFFYQNFCILI